MSVAGAEARERIETIDGAELFVRPIGPGDRGRLEAAFNRLSPASRFRRFLGSTNHLTDEQLRRFTAVDHRSNEALVAVGADEQIEGVARYAAIAGRPGVAEVAVTVSDRWQGHGVGTALLSRLMRRASLEGFEMFTASCFVSNKEMLLLFHELGRDVRECARRDGVMELEIELPAAGLGDNSLGTMAGEYRWPAAAGDLSSA